MAYEKREEMEKYLNEYLFPLLKNVNLEEYEMEILFQPYDIFPPKLTKIHSINGNSELVLTFFYSDGDVQNESVDTEQLSFDALFLLIKLLERLVD